MDRKEMMKQFRAAAWPSPAELEIFLMGADVVPAQELLKLLAVLTDTKAAQEPSHRARVTAFKRLVENAPDPQLFLPFVRALKGADAAVRAALGELLPKVNQVAGHAELAQLLRLQDVALRRLTANVLRHLGGKSVFDLASSLAREDIPGRTEAIELAATVGGHHAAGVLGQVVAGAKTEHRIQALKLLGDARLMARNTPAAIEAIVPALEDPVDAVRVQAVAAYAALCDEAHFHLKLAPHFESTHLGLLRAVVEGARRFPSHRTMALLARRFRLGPTALRLTVLSTLEAIGTDDTLPLLTEALNHKQITVRNRAAEVLSTLSAQKKVNLARTLMWLLRSRDVNVRRIGVDLAKKVGDPNGELWPTLLRFLRDEDWWVRERVIDALVEMAGTQLTRHIVGYLQDPSDVVRRYAVDVLMRLKDPQSLGALVRSAMGDADWWVRERAIEAIGLLRDHRAVPYVVDLMSRAPELRLACLGALEALKATDAGPHVAALVAMEDPDLRLAALRCLDVVGTPELGAQVQPAATDADHRVRQAARHLLEKWRVQPPTMERSGGRALSPLDRLLVEMARVEGDDLLLAAGRVPFVKSHGKVTPMEGQPVLDERGMEALLLPHLNEAQRQAVAECRDLDFSHEVKAEGLRFRANLFRQQTGLAAVFRIIKNTLLSIDQLGLPPIVQTFGDMKNGLVLVGGPTGSGKSTTLASIIDYINRTYSRHIVTLEDPVEVLHERKQGLVNQREIGTHTRSFDAALRGVLRQDPDVLLVGEMRDLATISFAVTAAETGHLVFGTLHTVSADTTVDRLVNAFPAGQQSQVRSMLAESLRAVLCQQLLRRVDKPGRVLSVEVMLNTDAVSNLIRKGKAFQLPSLITTGRDQGMQSMDGELKRLVRAGIVSEEEAYMKAINKKDFNEFLEEQRKEREKTPAAAPAGVRAAG